MEKRNNQIEYDNSFNFGQLISGLTLTLTIISLIVIGVWIWFSFFNVQPTTTFTAQINTIGAGSTKYVMEFNQLRGKSNGEELNELKLTYYTSESLNTEFSTGIQTIGDVTTKSVKVSQNGWWIFSSEYVYKQQFTSDHYYYNRDRNSYTYKAIENISERDYYVIQIEDKIYQLHFENNVLNSKNSLWIKKNYVSDPTALFVAMSEACESMDTGDYVINFPLGEFFGISKFNEETQQFDALDIADKNKIYIEAKIHIEDRGVTSNRQSIFGVVANDSKYNTSDVEDVAYWKSQAVVVLTQDNFNNDEGYLTLKSELINYFSRYEDIYVLINLNLDNTEIKGFNYYALLGIKVDEISITSSTPVEFEILNSALKNTGLEVSDIKTNNVSLVGVVYEQI